MLHRVRHKKLFVILVLAVVVVVGLYLYYDLNPDIRYFALARRTRNLQAMVISAVAIAVASTVFQTITQNRILTPSVLGLDSLYLLIQTLVVWQVGGSLALMQNFWLSLVLMVIFSVLLFILIFRRTRNLLLLLMVGTIFGTLFSSISSFLQVLIDPNEFFIIQNRMFARFDSINHPLIMPAMMVVVFVLIYILTKLKVLDVVALGREHSQNLGVDYNKVTIQMLVLVAILVAVSSALSGPVTFLGLIVINIVYQLFKDYRHAVLVPAGMLVSILAIVLGQFFVERVFNFGITIGVVINFVGGIYFMYILIKENQQV